MSAKSNLGCEAGCGLKVLMVGMVSDHGRIVPALHMTFQLFSENCSAVFGEV